MAKKDQISVKLARHYTRTAGTQAPRREGGRTRTSTFIRVGKRGQIVIPATIRRELGIEDGSQLWVRADDEGRILLEAVPDDPLDRFIAFGRKAYEGVDVDAYIRGLRDEWDDR